MLKRTFRLIIKIPTVTKIKNSLFFNLKVKNQYWWRVLNETQTEVIKQKGHYYYKSDYRAAELYYWINIPKWITEDFNRDISLKCLDIGCAYGTLALFCKKYFSNSDIYCIDNTDRYISKQLIKRYNFHFSKNNVEFNKFPWKKKFEIIIFTETIEHLNFHPLPTMKKIRSLLAVDGRCYLSTPDARDWGKVTQYYKSLDEMPKPKRG